MHCAMLSDEDLEQLSVDKRIVRNARKIASVRHNAQFVREVAREHGSFGKYLADCVITSYSIHYTKLYESARQVRSRAVGHVADGEPRTEDG